MIARTRISYGLWNWANAIYALILREIRCRFAGDPIGYAWAFIVPLLWVGTLMIFFTMLDRQPGIPVDKHAFIATGVIPYVMFRYMIGSMGRVVSAHRHLTTFGRIQISDMMLAGALLEFFNAVIVLLVIWISLALIYAPISIHDPLEAEIGLLLTALVAGTFGRLATVLGLISETAKRVIPVMLRPMFWISGIFFTATEIPPALLKYLWWNPLLHTVEIVRSGVFRDYQSGFADVRVPILMSMVFLALSYLLQTAVGRHRDGRELV